MSTPELAVFAGLALLYAALITAAVWGGMRLIGRPLGVAGTATTGACAFFLSLTHHPFPDPATLDCSDGGQRALLTPFRFLDSVERHWVRDAPLRVWLHDLTVSSAAMNLFLCMAIGAGLAACGLRAARALAFGAGLTALVEVSQYTGVFGLYDCPYRHLDVDDVILNVAGVMLGYAAWRLWSRPRQVA